jgi:hypothetical protein
MRLLMTTQRPDGQTHSLASRKAAVIALAVPAVAALVVMLLHHQGFINIEDFGLNADHMYWGGFGAIAVCFAAIFALWRCPRCRAYLGKELSPPRCPSCGADFG